MQLGDRTGNGETQTRSAGPIRPCPRPVSTKESIKDPSLKLIWNTTARVGYRDLVGGVDSLEPHFDRSTFGCELDRIVEEVGNHLPKETIITAIRRFLQILRLEVNTLALRQHAGGTHCICDDFVKIEFADVEWELVHVGAGKCEHVLHDALKRRACCSII